MPNARSASGRLAELDALIERLRSPRTMDTEAGYVEMFDRGRGTSLHLFEHVHGDSRDRGPAMVDLLKTYEQAGLFLAPGELPDYLPVLLQFASTQPPAQAAELLREVSHILQVMFSALLQRDSVYASVVAALLDLAGEKAQAVKLPDEPELDESWEEPLAFGGCSTEGQAAPGQPQPIHIVKNAAHTHPRSARMNTAVHNFLFNVYPYICLAVFFMGSLARFDRDQYTWKSDSSQLLRSRPAALGQQPVPRRHPVPVLRPSVRPADAALRCTRLFVTAPQKQFLAVVAGGIAGLICFVGLSLLLHRRIFDPRIRLTSHRTDLAILVILWVQLVIGLVDAAGVAAPCVRPADHAAAGQLPAGHRHLPARRRPGGGHGLALPGAHAAGHDDLPAVPVQPPGACVERLRHRWPTCSARTRSCVRAG